jgi:hypothetical protein
VKQRIHRQVRTKPDGVPDLTSTAFVNASTQRPKSFTAVRFRSHRSVKIEGYRTGYESEACV